MENNQMSKKLEMFENTEFGNVRALLIDDEPWFVGKDVAGALGYTNARKALIDHVDDEDKCSSKVTKRYFRHSQPWINLY